MARICPSCGGIIGRDCFNPQECMLITEQMNAQGSSQEIHDSYQQGYHEGYQAARNEPPILVTLDDEIKEDRTIAEAFELRFGDTPENARPEDWCTYEQGYWDGNACRNREVETLKAENSKMRQALEAEGYCTMCHEKKKKRALLVCDTCYDSFDGDRRSFWDDDFIH